MPNRSRWLIVALLTLCCVLPRAAHAADPEIALDVDASEAARKLLHIRVHVPVRAGTVTLAYPKWIPGEHGPTGPVSDVVGLHVLAGERELPWRRDDVDMYVVRVEVPSGVEAIDVRFDFLSAATPDGFSSAASFTEHLALLSWNQVLMYPAGEASDALRYRASLTLPQGWSYGTALPLEKRDGQTLRFAPVSLTTLVDSPVITGEYYRSVDLSPGETPKHSIDIASDSKAGLAMTSEQVAAYRRLIRESYALFGARHYRSYHFLLSLSDHVAHFGLEHHESSDDRAPERMWLEHEETIGNSNLMPHELVHSWNGKYRRPVGLATPDYGTPMKGEMLWVYEGLTQYLGFVLAGRSGVRSKTNTLTNLALQAATLDERPGRRWRPLVDTGVEAQLLYEAPAQGESYRRSTDFYDEGLLLWLEADVRIRQLSHNTRSLDDFCKRFHGGTNGPPALVTYTLDDVIGAMDAVAHDDWRTFFESRVNKVAPHAPLAGITSGGWTVTFTDSLPELLEAFETNDKELNETFTIGATIGTESGDVVDVVPGSPADRAGLSPGMTLVGVNQRHYTSDVLRDAIRATKDGAPLVLLADNGDFFRTCDVSYRGGLRFPVLTRAKGTPDVISAILAPHAGTAPKR